MKEKIKKNRVEFLIDSIHKNKKRIFQRLKSRIEDLKKYFFIKREYKKRNIKNDLELQKKYKKFYRMRFPTQRFFKEYFTMLSNKETDLRKILDRLYEIPTGNRTKAIHFSFATKLLHTVNNNLPIYDSLVGGALGLEVIGKNKGDKINFCIETYDKLKKYHKEMLGNKIIKKIILNFRRNFNCDKEKISDTKVLDFLIWAGAQLKNKNKIYPEVEPSTTLKRCGGRNLRKNVLSYQKNKSEVVDCNFNLFCFWNFNSLVGNFNNKIIDPSLPKFGVMARK